MTKPRQRVNHNYLNNILLYDQEFRIWNNNSHMHLQNIPSKDVSDIPRDQIYEGVYGGTRIVYDNSCVLPSKEEHTYNIDYACTRTWYGARHEIPANRQYEMWMWTVASLE